MYGTCTLRLDRLRSKRADFQCKCELLLTFDRAIPVEVGHVTMWVYSSSWGGWALAFTRY